MIKPIQQIRAQYDDKTIRVYQAYNNAIADSALELGTFASPPFKIERMTWIKPSFLWMMYRSAWGKKDNGQSRILAIDICREGFEWALEHSCLSHFEEKIYVSREKWQAHKNKSPVRVQWDPERDIFLQPLKYRTIQIGLSKKSVELYVNSWIKKITDVTELTGIIRLLVEKNETNDAVQKLLPKETYYPIPDRLKTRLGVE